MKIFFMLLILGLAKSINSETYTLEQCQNNIKIIKNYDKQGVIKDSKYKLFPSEEVEDALYAARRRFGVNSEEFNKKIKALDQYAKNKDFNKCIEYSHFLYRQINNYIDEAKKITGSEVLFKTGPNFTLYSY